LFKRPDLLCLAGQFARRILLAGETGYASLAPFAVAFARASPTRALVLLALPWIAGRTWFAKKMLEAWSQGE
jgi:hypothetical protein